MTNSPPNPTRAIGLNVLVAIIVTAALISIFPERDYVAELEMIVESGRCG